MGYHETTLAAYERAEDEWAREESFRERILRDETPALVKRLLALDVFVEQALTDEYRQVIAAYRKAANGDMAAAGFALVDCISNAAAERAGELLDEAVTEYLRDSKGFPRTYHEEIDYPSEPDAESIDLREYE